QGFDQVAFGLRCGDGEAEAEMPVGKKRAAGEPAAVPGCRAVEPERELHAIGEDPRDPAVAQVGMHPFGTIIGDGAYLREIFPQHAFMGSTCEYTDPALADLLEQGRFARLADR